MTSKRRGSPIITTTFQPKRKLVPVVARKYSSDWSTVDQFTIVSTSEDEDEDIRFVDHETAEDSDNIRPEQLREAVNKHLALDVVAVEHQRQLARSPTVESLGDLLDLNGKKFKLLTGSDSSTSSHEESSITLPSNMSSVMTSTMMSGSEEIRQQMKIRNISAIQSRQSQDPRVSEVPEIRKEKSLNPKNNFKNSEEEVMQGLSGASIQSSRHKLLASTPARMVRFPPGESGNSLGLSSIHSSEAEGSMLVPRVEREIITEERVEETDSEDALMEDAQNIITLKAYPELQQSFEDEVLLGLSGASTQPSRHKLLASTPARSVRDRRCRFPPEESGNSLGLSSIHSSGAGGSMLVPRMEREIITEERVEDTDSEDTSMEVAQNNTTLKACPSRKLSFLSTHLPDDDPGEVPHPPALVPQHEDITSLINAELSCLSPPTRNIRSSGSSADTSGEIFSAVVHKNMVTMVVPYTPTIRRVGRKRFRLATRPANSTQLNIFSPAEYYKGKQASERMFDQVEEEEDDTDSAGYNDVFSLR